MGGQQDLDTLIHNVYLGPRNLRKWILTTLNGFAMENSTFSSIRSSKPRDCIWSETSFSSLFAVRGSHEYSLGEIRMQVKITECDWLIMFIKYPPKMFQTK